MNTIEKITFSIVSHGQGLLIRSLLADLSYLPHHNFDVLITINIPEDESVYQNLPFPLKIIRNSAPKGFGENHNIAFLHSSNHWFAVVNPDIRLNTFDFQLLLLPFQDQDVAAVAPIVLSSNGKIEDSARRFPTLLRFAKRILLNQRGSDYPVAHLPFQVDWVAGMFIVFRRNVYQRIDGFDDSRFFMYLEDADICRRIGGLKLKVIVNPDVQVTHLAQRASHRSFKHMYWHLISAFRFLTDL